MRISPRLLLPPSKQPKEDGIDINWYRSQRRVSYARKRAAALSLFGAACAQCGMDDWRCLQLDHVAGGGRSKSLLRLSGTSDFTRTILPRLLSGDYQVLCATCNWIKRAENNEVGHETKDRTARLRRRAIDILGGKCKKCGFEDIRALQIDHVEGNGRSDPKRKLPKSSYYEYVICNHASGQYQVLCANCNWIKRVERSEIPKRKFMDVSPANGLSRLDAIGLLAVYLQEHEQVALREYPLERETWEEEPFDVEDFVRRNASRRLVVIR